jgi:hypothetical protein
MTTPAAAPLTDQSVSMPVSREAVVHAFQLLLGRDPESESSIAAHMALGSLTELATVLLGSAEFRDSPRFKDVLQVAHGEAEPEPALPPARQQCTPLTAAVLTSPPVAPAPVTAPASATHPYAGLPARHFWRRAMELPPCSEVDPVTGSKQKIAPTDKVVTAGSCFAQHMGKALTRHGLHHFVTEAGEDLRQTNRMQRQFGLFSARCGNIYTARQLVQLIERCQGQFTPQDEAWKRPDGRFVDPFRPQIEPGGFLLPAEVTAARVPHFAAVRRMLAEMDVFVFTLGGTEAWRRRSDGAVFPVAPGVLAGTWNPKVYEFVTFGMHEVASDLRAAVAAIRTVNPHVRFVFTVSPVPLIASYQDQHVLVSSTESKAILRSAVGEVVAADRQVEYFPSYEIVTGQHAHGRYFAADLRSVTDAGVAHVMQVFMRHYVGTQTSPAAAKPVNAGARPVRVTQGAQREAEELVFDEEGTKPVQQDRR